MLICQMKTNILILHFSITYLLCLTKETQTVYWMVLIFLTLCAVVVQTYSRRLILTSSGHFLKLQASV